MKNFVKALITVIIIAALAVGIYALWKYTGIGKQMTSSIGEFRVVYNGKTFNIGKDNYICLPSSGEAKFEVLGFNSTPYTVKVEPNTDFTYDVDGNTYHFEDEQLTDYFIDPETVYGNAFVINCDKNYAVGDVLKHIWGKDIEAETRAIYPYAITVVSSAGEKVVINAYQWQYADTQQPGSTTEPTEPTDPDDPDGSGGSETPENPTFPNKPPIERV